MAKKANVSLVLAASVGAGLAVLGLAAGVLYFFFGIATTFGCSHYSLETAPANGGCTSETRVWVPTEPHWIMVDRG